MDTNQKARIRPAAAIVNALVMSANKQPFGRIRELMLDVTSGHIASALIDLQPLGESMSELYAVPWKAFRYDEQQGVLFLEVDEQRVRSGPRFKPDGSAVPDLAWQRDVYRHYGIPRYWEEENYLG